MPRGLENSDTLEKEGSQESLICVEPLDKIRVFKVKGSIILRVGDL